MKTIMIILTILWSHIIPNVILYMINQQKVFLLFLFNSNVVGVVAFRIITIMINVDMKRQRDGENVYQMVL